MFKPRISVETIEMGKKPRCQVCIKISAGRGNIGLFVQARLLMGINRIEDLFFPRFFKTNDKTETVKMISKPFLREGFMPLPVAFISTISGSGVRNIAPYSCIMPVLRPLDLICLASAHKRDTLKNIRETGEFVVNLVDTDFSDKVIPTAKFSPPEADEFELAGLDEKPSKTIRAPGIAGAYTWMECDLFKLYEETKYVLIMGKVLHLEVADEVLSSEGEMDISTGRFCSLPTHDTGVVTVWLIPRSHALRGNAYPLFIPDLFIGTKGLHGTHYDYINFDFFHIRPHAEHGNNKYFPLYGHRKHS
jgi:flavin reductase (DIM6/NTAB) family NADH-FMN oxidoreductase RutF